MACAGVYAERIMPAVLEANENVSALPENLPPPRDYSHSTTF